MRTFFNKDWVQENELKIEESSKRELRLEDGNTKPLRQTIQERLQTTNDETEGTYWITKLNWDAVLEVDWIDQTRWGMSNMETTELPNWLKEYEQVFQSKKTGLSSRRKGVNHVINLKEPEPKSSLLISTKLEEQQFIKNYLDDLLRKRWIRLNKFSCGVSLFLISKKEELRPVIDYRKLNEITVTDSTSLSLIDDIMDQIQENSVFNKIDLKNAFNQIRIKEGDE